MVRTMRSAHPTPRTIVSTLTASVNPMLCHTAAAVAGVAELLADVVQRDAGEEQVADRDERDDGDGDGAERDRCVRQGGRARLTP